MAISLNDPKLALAFRVLAAGLSFAFGVTIARLLGIEAFGQFSVLFAAINIGVVAAMCGHESLATRNIATALSGGIEMDRALQYRSTARKHVWIVGVLIAAFVALVLVMTPSTSAWCVPWLPLLLLIPVVARTRLSQAMLRGAHLAGLAVVPDGVLRPAFALIAAYGLSASSLAGQAFAVSLAVPAGGALAATIAVRWESGRIPWQSYVPNLRAAAPNAHLQRFSLAIFASSLCAVLDSQIAMLVLGTLGSKQDAATFAAADRYAQAAALIGQTIYLASASRIADCYARSDMPELRALLAGVVRKVSVATACVCLPAALFAELLLKVFGQEFADGSACMQILMLSVLINTIAGPVGVILLMMNGEARHLQIMMIGIAVQGVLLAMLVPLQGAIGAAFSILAAKIVWNIGMLVVIKKRFALGPILLRP